MGYLKVKGGKYFYREQGAGLRGAGLRRASLPVGYSQKTGRPAVTYLHPGDGQTPSQERKTLLMIHGLGGSSRDFDFQFRYFSRKYRCIAPDLAGCGRSSLAEDNYSLESSVSQIKRLFRQLKLKSVILLGHSMGGMIALEYGLKYPRDIDKLILVSCLPFVKNNLTYLLGLRIFQYIYPLIPKSAIRFYLFRLNISPQNLNEDLSKWLKTELNQFQKKDLKVMSEYVNSLVGWNILGRLKGIKVPTLIIKGEKDFIVSNKSLEILHQKIKGSKESLIKGCRHCPMYEKPLAFNQILEEFI